MADLFIAARAGDVQLCLERARLGIVAGMNNGGIGHRRTICDVILLFNDGNAQMIHRQVSRQHCAGDTCPDNHNIIHNYISPFFQQ